ncbi:MAG TPA: carbohydrate-binding module family 20 domain-containing protein [Myxococcales bacterium]|nr:carbohydrate-binding module family 20 domain-containing protein [Myxococcales bacterium]
MIGVLSAAGLAVAFACGEPEPSVVAVPFTVEIGNGVVRPSGSTVGVVGNHSSLGATADMPQGDPLKALKLRQTPDAKWVGAAWLPPGQQVDYVVYMLNPQAPELVTRTLADGGTEPVPDGGVNKRHVTWVDDKANETPKVLAFDVPRNVVRPCINFTVTVPANTPAGDTIYMAGSDDQLGPWNPAKQALTKNADGTYGVRLCFDQGKALDYKYVRNGDWAYVEKNADGTERANRTLTVTETVPHADTVLKWADL